MEWKKLTRDPPWPWDISWWWGMYNPCIFLQLLFKFPYQRLLPIVILDCHVIMLDRYHALDIWFSVVSSGSFISTLVVGGSVKKCQDSFAMFILNNMSWQLCKSTKSLFLQVGMKKTNFTHSVTLFLISFQLLLVII